MTMQPIGPKGVTMQPQAFNSSNSVLKTPPPNATMPTGKPASQSILSGPNQSGKGGTIDTTA